MIGRFAGPQTISNHHVWISPREGYYKRYCEQKHKDTAELTQGWCFVKLLFLNGFNMLFEFVKD